MRILTVRDCPLCSKIIWRFKRLPLIQFNKGSIILNFKKVPYEMNDKGSHFFILQNDGSRMQIAICKQCLETLTDVQVKQIFTDIVFTKLEAIKKDKRKELHYKLFDRIRQLEIFKWAKTEKEIIDYLQEIKNEKIDSLKQFK